MEIAAEYSYTDETGKELFQAVRLDPKDFRQRHLNGGGTYEWGLGNARRVIYRLPKILEAIKRGRWIFIVEGEKDADRMWAEGLAATTCAMGAGKWDDSYSYQLRQAKRIGILPDNDDSGRDHAQKVAASLIRAGAQDVRIIELPGLPEKGDVSDWLDADGTTARLKRIAHSADKVEIRSSNAEDFEPLPLRRDPPAAAPFPVDALGGVLAPAVEDVAEILRCPIAIVGTSFLAAATLAAQSLINVRIDGRTRPVSCYFVSIGKTGERKTGADEMACAPHMKREMTLRDQWDLDLDEYAAELAAWKKARDQALSGKNTMAAKKHALKDLGPQPKPPPEPVIATEEPTYEGLIKIFQRGWPSVGLFSDEGGRFLGGYSMGADHALKTAAGLSKLWDSGRVTRTRGGEEQTFVGIGLRLSMHLMIQPVIAPKLFADDLLVGQGLVSRILPVWPQSTIGGREYQEADATGSAAYRRYFGVISDLLETDPPTDEKGRLTPRAIEPDPQAKRIWIEYHDHVEFQLGPGGPLEAVVGLGAKIAEHALRMAGVLTVITDPDCQVIDSDTMEDGIALADYYLHEALRIEAMSRVSREVDSAEKLIAWAEARGGRFASETLYQSGPNPLRSKEAADPVIRLLEAHDRIQPLPRGTVVDGKARLYAWEVIRVDV